MKTLEYRDGSLWLIDQTLLPLDPTFIECCTVHQIAEAIKSLRVRGAPAIGCAAAYGVAIAARTLAADGLCDHEFESRLDIAIGELWQTRPTAINLFWALERMRAVTVAHRAEKPADVAAALLSEADRILHEDEAANRQMGIYGADLIPDPANILTHCNAGSLATGAFGTALGVIRAAHEQRKRVHVWVDETRPLLQGARLTSWELKELGIHFTLITDSMAGYFMSRGDVDLVMVGADRIVANGDGANKIGTYGLAVLAKHHGIPFYFVAPTSTVDLSTASGRDITIEERSPEEVTTFRGVRTAPEGTGAANPAFDVTPADLVTAIVTENGIARSPFRESLTHFVEMTAGPLPSAERAYAAPETK